MKIRVPRAEGAQKLLPLGWRVVPEESDETGIVLEKTFAVEHTEAMLQAWPRRSTDFRTPVTFVNAPRARAR